jgi:sulfate adenylyltransferase
MTTLIASHGGALKECLLPKDQAQSLKLAARDYLSWDLTARQLCDVELLLNGGFSPLHGFMGRADYEAVVRDMRLAGDPA